MSDSKLIIELTTKLQELMAASKTDIAVSMARTDYLQGQQDALITITAGMLEIIRKYQAPPDDETRQ